MASRQWRTHEVAELSAVEIGAVVRVAGWVAFVRRHRQATFLGIRDGTGTVQVVLDGPPPVGCVGESCVSVEGETAVKRPARNAAPGAAEVEVRAGSVRVLSPSAPLPLSEHSSVHTRDLYRHIDLRFPEQRRSVMFRADLLRTLRSALHEDGFVELETPYLTHGTSGGAREFVVTSTVHDERRFHLPQSAQLHKELLVVGGFERFFLVGRAFRDEGNRARRQLEFTVLDIEVAFQDLEDVVALVERHLERAVRELGCGRIDWRTGGWTDTTDTTEVDRPSDGADVHVARWRRDPPLFRQRDGRLESYHQPFDAPTAPWTEHFEHEPLAARSAGASLAVNGQEVAFGSERIHDPTLLRRVLAVTGEDLDGALLGALDHGAPPHSGISVAVDQLATSLLRQSVLRSVIPFPAGSATRGVS